MTIAEEVMELAQIVFLGHVNENFKFRGEQKSFLTLLF